MGGEIDCIKWLFDWWLIVKNRLFNNRQTYWWKGSGVLFWKVKRTILHLFAGFFSRRPSSSLWERTLSPWRRSSLPMTSAPHGNEDGRHGKVLRTSRQKGWKNFFHKCSAPQPCAQIFDSPGVEVYHIVAVFSFRITKQDDIRRNCRFHNVCCQSKVPEP